MVEYYKGFAVNGTGSINLFWFMVEYYKGFAVNGTGSINRENALPKRTPLTKKASPTEPPTRCSDLPSSY